MSIGIELCFILRYRYAIVWMQDTDKSGFRLNGLPIVGPTWTPVIDSSPPMSVTSFTAPAGAHMFSHAEGKHFGVYIYAVSPDDCAFAFPAGMHLDFINEVFEICLFEIGFHRLLKCRLRLFVITQQ